MIREIKSDSQLKINVYFRPTRDDPVCYRAHLAKDVPSSPFGDSFEVVSFWIDDKLMIYPMDMIDHCELYEV